jgi:hypothetical protein
MLNPGGRNDALNYGAAYLDECRKRLTFETTVPFMPLDDRFRDLPGARYWRARLRELIEHVGMEAVRTGVGCLQYVPYPSLEFRRPRVILPSQQFTFALCREAVREQRTIVVMRGARLWTTAVPELATASPVYAKNARAASVSRKNLPDGDFERIVAALKRRDAAISSRGDRRRGGCGGAGSRGRRAGRCGRTRRRRRRRRRRR